MATGEVIGAEELGGAKVHAVTTGLADQISSDECDTHFLFHSLYIMLTWMNIRFDAISKAREWVASLHVRTTKPRMIEPLPPRYPIDDLLSIVNPDIRKPFDMSEVLLRIVDDSRLSVFKPKYGPNIITAWAHIMGKRRNPGVLSGRSKLILIFYRLPCWYRSQPTVGRQPERGRKGCAIHSNVQPAVWSSILVLLRAS